MSSRTNFNSGDLYQLVLDLGINTGKLNRSDINAWTATNCEATSDFLYWFSTFIDTNNILTNQDISEYELLVDGNFALNNQHYTKCVEETERNYPKIFDVESNKVDVECLQEELIIYEDDLKYFEQSILTSRSLTKSLQKRLNKLSQEEINVEIKKKSANEECLKFARKLDLINNYLEEQIRYCQKTLISFNCDNESYYITNMPVEERNNYHTHIFSKIKNLDSSFNTQQMKLEDTMCSNTVILEDTLEELHTRILCSILASVHGKIKCEELESIVNYLNDLNFINMCSLQNSHCFSGDAIMLEAKRREFNSMSIDFEAVAAEAVNKFVNLPKLHFIKSEIDYRRQDFEYITTVKNLFEEILAYHCALYLMYEKENRNIKTMEMFFRDMYQYTTSDVLSYQERISMMQEAVDMYKNYDLLTIGKKCRFIFDIGLIVSNTEKMETEQDVAKIINAFTNEYFEVCNKYYIQDYLDFKHQCRTMEDNLMVYKTFLSGPTQECVVIPQKLYEILMEHIAFSKSQATAIKSVLVEQNKVKDKINNNKWFSLKRQLWMYFICSPNKVLDYIEEVEHQVKKELQIA